MQVSVEESGVIERKVTVCVARDEVDREIEKRLRKMAQRVRIPGFRPGKAPQNIINQRYGAQITNEVVSDTINTSYREALGKEEIVPAGLVSIEPKPFVSGDDLQYVATIELYPDIPSPTLDGRTIEKPLCEITTDDIDRTLEDIRKRNADFVAKQADAQAHTGDRLTIDFDGRIDGEPFAGGSGTDHQFILGDGHMLESFESGLVGLGVGESKQIATTFPDDYPGAEVAGKAAEFSVKVTAVERPVLPELDNAFAEKLGITEGGMEKMRAEIEVSLKRELAARMRLLMRAQVMGELIKVNDIKVPKALVEGEIDHMIKTVTQRMEEQGNPLPDASGLERERFAADAKRQVMLGLIVRGIVEKYDLKPDADAIRMRVEEMASGYDDGTAMINWYYAEPARLQPIEAMVLEEQVITRMCESATVTEKKVSFLELMNPQT